MQAEKFIHAKREMTRPWRLEKLIGSSATKTSSSLGAVSLSLLPYAGPA